jgi:hypothetical protein
VLGSCGARFPKPIVDMPPFTPINMSSTKV